MVLDLKSTKRDKDGEQHFGLMTIKERVGSRWSFKIESFTGQGRKFYHNSSVITRKGGF